MSQFVLLTAVISSVTFAAILVGYLPVPMRGTSRPLHPHLVPIRLCEYTINEKLKPAVATYWKLGLNLVQPVK